MADKTKINNVRYSWSSIEAVDMGYGTMEEIQEISWEVSQDNKLTYGRGAKPHGYAVGNVEYSGQIVMSRYEYAKQFMPWVLKQPNVKSLPDLPPFSLGIQMKLYEGDPIQTTRLIGVKFGGVQNAASQGSTDMKVTLPFIFMDIEETGLGV